ncbi:MAG: glutamate-5-semialdehyde dehydrogenase [Candidatus Omnitrophica bacterium]|nr:glutamate-5-semialdehyde dehydrogenase [Candidatus Omnitrophota bacterium]
MKQNAYVLKTVKEAKKASFSAARLSTAKKNTLLREMAKALLQNKIVLMRENRKDLAYARAAGISSAMLDRLALTEKRIKEMVSAVAAVARIPDPIGKSLACWRRPNGLVIEKRCVPLGVILIIYEARPNVTTECASLCLKSNNAVILRGGKESFYSNVALVKIFRAVLKKNRIDENIISFITMTDRNVVDGLLKQDKYINLVIPRGGESLIRKVVELSTIPVIKHYKGICHVFVDASASLAVAQKIAMNAKCQRPSVCNAMETLLVHQKIARTFLTKFAEAYCAVGGEIYGCAKTRAILKGCKCVKVASDRHYATEYLDLKLSVKVVKDTQAAIDHINTFGSAHTDAIISRTNKNIELFVSEVDSSSVMVNASTRFSDGNQYGFGAEIGISTDKIHARGPMGLDGLTSYKYIVRGRGQVRE